MQQRYRSYVEKITKEEFNNCVLMQEIKSIDSQSIYFKYIPSLEPFSKETKLTSDKIKLAKKMSEEITEKWNALIQLTPPRLLTFDIQINFQNAASLLTKLCLKLRFIGFEKNETSFQEFYKILQKCQRDYISQLNLLQTYTKYAMTYYSQLQEAKTRSDEETAVEKEIRKLKKEIQQLKNEIPSYSGLFRALDKEFEIENDKILTELQLKFSKEYRLFFNRSIYDFLKGTKGSPATISLSDFIEDFCKTTKYTFKR
jgi:hypothetical protein